MGIDKTTLSLNWVLQSNIFQKRQGNRETTGENFAAAVNLRPTLIRAFRHSLNTLSLHCQEGPQPLKNFTFFGEFQIAYLEVGG